MNFTKKLLSAVAVLLLSVMAFAETYYVSVKNSNLKAKPSGASKNLASVKYGDPVTWVKTDGAWTLVSTGKTEGWISTNAITKRKIVNTGKVSTDAKEIALAGKGFSEGLETDSENTNYTAVNSVERNAVSESENASFKTKGGLKVSE